jgi:sulfide:quinone oxidoreductase
VLIAGGGVAGLETMFALRELAGDAVDVELLSPEYDFWYRPLSVGEPFDVARAQRFELPALAAAAGAAFTPGAIAVVEPVARRVQTSRGAELTYDALVIATGTRPVPVLHGALTFRGPSDVDRLRALLAELDAGRAKRVVFTLPRRSGWPLPVYELALMTAAHVSAHGVRGTELSLVTPEAAPLQTLGPAVSAAVSDRLHAHGIALYTGRYPVSFEDGRLELLPDEALPADQVVALARLEGQRIPGLPHGRDGFLVTDSSGRVDALDDV